MIIFSKKKTIVILSLLLVFILLGAVSATSNDTETINANNDDLVKIDDNSVEKLSNDAGNADKIGVSNNESEKLKGTVEFNGNTFSDLQEKIRNAQSGDVINLNNDVIQDTTTNIAIDKTITINGNGFTLNANNISRIFYVHPSAQNTVLKNIVFKNGYSNSGAGAISWQANSGQVINCTFIDNLANEAGGAISWQGRYGTIINSTFENNIAKTSGGAVYWGHDDGKIDNCTFKNNSVNGDSNTLGGAINWQGTNGKLTNSKFINNLITCVGYAYGGAIYYYKDSNVTNCIFINNGASSSSSYNCYGGAIYFESNGVNKIYNSTFENNYINSGYYGYAGAIYSVGNCYLYGSTFTNNSVGSNYEAKGGAVYAKNLHIDNSNFTNNSAITEQVYYSNYGNLQSYGGAIYANSRADISNSNFISNIAYSKSRYLQSSGGAVYGSADIINSTFIENSANNGGAIGGGSVSSLNSKFINNSAVYQTYERPDNFEIGSYGSGSAMYVGNVDLRNSTFLNNHMIFSNYSFKVEDDYEQNILKFTFDARQNFINAIYTWGSVTCSNITYWNNTNISNNNIGRSDCSIGQEVTLVVYDRNLNEFITLKNLTDNNGQIIFNYTNYKDEYFLYKVFYSGNASYYSYNEGKLGMGDFYRLQRWISNSRNDNQIELQRDYVYTLGIDTITNGIQIKNKARLSIEGKGYKIDALNQTRIFAVDNSNSITFRNLILVKGMQYHLIVMA